jgi:hypothetical protein
MEEATVLMKLFRIPSTATIDPLKIRNTLIQVLVLER